MSKPYPIDVNQAKAALYNAQREKIELQLKVKRGELIETSKAREYVAAVLNPVRDKIVHLPSLAAKCNLEKPDVARDILQQYAAEIIDLMIAASKVEDSKVE